MTYVVAGGHVESLKSGRLVSAGNEISNAEARENPRLIERGVLIERPAKKPKSKASTTPAPEPEEKKEESQ